MKNAKFNKIIGLIEFNAKDHSHIISDTLKNEILGMQMPTTWHDITFHTLNSLGVFNRTL